MKDRGYRTNGAIGALLDEYEKAMKELKALVSTLTEKEFVTIVDHETNDPACRSIQTILSHVVGAGKHYVEVIRKQQGEQMEYSERRQISSVPEIVEELDKMFQENERLFQDYPNLKIEVHETAHKILTRWGQRYDVEQLFEHAIVHVLRHRRQIERFLLTLRLN